MQMSKNFKLISISMLLIVELAACGKQSSTETAGNKVAPKQANPAVTEQSQLSQSTTNKQIESQRQSEYVNGDPSAWLSQIVKSNAVVRGYIDNQSIPSIELAFSNGHMEVVSEPGPEVTAPGAKRYPFTSGLVQGATNPNATCVGIETEDRIGAIFSSSKQKGIPLQQILLCVVVRDFKMLTVSTVPKNLPKDLGVYDFKAVKGEVYISKYSDADSNSAFYRARVVK